MELQFAGAAREVTGSCHLVRVNGRQIALDCGLFQGHRAEADASNRRLPVPTSELDAIVLSHAHIDHAGRIPFLVREGFAGRIFCTAATRDLSAYMLMDSAQIQEKDAAFLARRKRSFIEPLYGARDVASMLEQTVGVPYHQTFDVVPGVRARFLDAGHILGSASVILDCNDGARHRRLVFSGDIGRAGLAIIRDPEFPTEADAVIMESTYGDRDHPPLEDARAVLGQVIRDTAARGGRVLIPAFAVGRTQELLYDLHALARAGRIPRIPVFIDSPLAIDVTSVFELHPDCFDSAEDLVERVQHLFRFDLLRYTREASESKALNDLRGPMVIIAASGMAESGRILHHLGHGASEPRNTILIVGFQAAHTLGRRLVEKRPMIKVFGEEIPLRAQVVVLNGYSAHADRRGLVDWITRVRASSPGLERVFLVHGEPAAQDTLAAALRAKGLDTRTPVRGETQQLGAD
ncbi:MAG TPA: MBL fold metallo-hydrolase [Gemmatimonadaceae bacterium]|nr:MBL fold metallo-hydrolase [Gemmatimonadaceae bacterium]